MAKGIYYGVGANISQFFKILGDTTYASWDGDILTVDNKGNNDIRVELEPLSYPCEMKFDLTSNSEANYISTAETDICVGVGNGSYTKTLGDGDAIIIEISEDYGGGKVTLSNIYVGNTKVSDSTSVARKVKKLYRGVDDVARKVKKAYIGIGGVARPFFSGGELAYYGTAMELSMPRRNMAATTIGNYALFAGGMYTTSSSLSDVVDAYSNSLTRTTPTTLGASRYAMAAATVGSYALFAGGFNSGGKAALYTYNTSLTRGIGTSLSTSRGYLAATTVGNYALFGGGNSGSSYYTKVDAYDASLTRTIPTALSQKRTRLAATAVGNYALFGGGYTGSSASNVVNAYDTSLTRTDATTLNYAYDSIKATTVGNYALFGGSYVNAYDTSLTRTIPTAFSKERFNLAATTVGNYALFGGGNSTEQSYHTDVAAYDTLLTLTIPTPLSVGRHELTAATVGNYALFGGGWIPGNCSSSVDVYTVA